jgi:thiol-disulfide isomerase/thioredoxin
VRLFLLLLVVAAAACTRVPPPAHADCAGVEDCRPALKLQTLDGAPLGDEALQGKVVLVNFWATWCAPCARELPALQSVYSRHQGQGFEILGVVTGDEATDVEVKGFAARRHVAYPLVRSEADLERRFQMGDALPTSMLYDRRGKLVRRWQGDISETRLEELVTKTLAD